MFDDPRDINRDFGASNPYRDRYAAMSDGSGWGAPIALLIVVLVIGALIAFAPTSNQQTAQNNPSAPQTQRSTPPAAPAPVAPAPRTTAPQQQ
jgi:hypothetical protein